jgi:hypothetical protein
VGRGFEPHPRSGRPGPVAQWSEQATHNRSAVGSIPTRPTTESPGQGTGKAPAHLAGASPSLPPPRRSYGVAGGRCVSGSGRAGRRAVVASDGGFSTQSCGQRKRAMSRLSETGRRRTTGPSRARRRSLVTTQHAPPGSGRGRFRVRAAWGTQDDRRLLDQPLAGDRGGGQGWLRARPRAGGAHRLPRTR